MKLKISKNTQSVVLTTFIIITWFILFGTGVVIHGALSHGLIQDNNTNKKYFYN